VGSVPETVEFRSRQREKGFLPPVPNESVLVLRAYDWDTGDGDHMLGQKRSVGSSCRVRRSFVPVPCSISSTEDQSSSDHGQPAHSLAHSLTHSLTRSLVHSLGVSPVLSAVTDRSEARRVTGCRVGRRQVSQGASAVPDLRGEPATQRGEALQ